MGYWGARPQGESAKAEGCRLPVKTRATGKIHDNAARCDITKTENTANAQNGARDTDAARTQTRTQGDANKHAVSHAVVHVWRVDAIFYL